MQAAVEIARAARRSVGPCAAAALWIAAAWPGCGGDAAPAGDAGSSATPAVAPEAAAATAEAEEPTGPPPGVDHVVAEGET
ncbi:MAG TPA: hypothetical protein VIL20_15940, partial [Sandaracinaceae bacterium]